jgi:hypothetical protein
MVPKIDRERLALELKAWLRSQQRFRTIRELESVTGIPYSSLRDYFCGHAAPVGDRLRRLASLTKVPSLLERLGSGTTAGETVAPSDELVNLAAKVREDADRLLADLEPFKRGTPQDRAVLKSTLPPRDVGYLTSLLKALYDEDQFETWLYFVEYKPERT